MISAKLCHYTTKFNSERHKSPTIFSIHRTLILFFPYSLYYWAFQDPPCRHRRCKITSNPPNRPIWVVDAQLWFADAAFYISKHPTSVKNRLHFHTFLPKALHNPNKCLTFAAPEPAKPLNDAQMSGSFFLLP